MIVTLLLDCWSPAGYQTGLQILITDAAEDAEVEYWEYVDDLTFAESKTRNKDGHLQNDLDNFVNWASQTVWP